jgi:ATP-binding cassette subfamily B protein
MKEETKRLWVKAYEIFRPFKRNMRLVFAFILAQQAVGLVSPYLQGRVIDYLITHKPISRTLWFAGAALVLYLLQTGIGQWRDRFEVKHLDFRLRRHSSGVAMNKVLSFSISQHTNQHSGIREAVMDRGQDSLTSLVYAVLYDFLPLVIEVTVMSVALLFLSFWLGIITLAGATLYTFTVYQMNKRFRPQLKELEDKHAETSRQYKETLRNATTIIANAQEKKAERECDEVMGKNMTFGEILWLKILNVMVRHQLIIGFTRFAIMVVGILCVYRGIYTPGYLVVFWSWSNNALGRIASMQSLQRRMMSLVGGVHKYFDLLDVESDVKTVRNPIRPEKFNGQIEFRNVTLAYQARSYFKDGEIVEPTSSSTHPALNKVSFTINAGETVAIVGGSGAGKSTLIHALLRAQDPDEGQILVDGADLRLLDLKQFREAVGVVEQQVALFDHTLRYNITYGLNGRGNTITDQQLAAIAKTTRLDRFFHKLEKGFDTVIGERGVKLSGGERQRVGIARAIIKEPAILVFDEATSNLDAKNEALIRQAIEQASTGRTTLIIAHRFSTIRHADRILVLDEGEIVGQGTHDQLATSCEPYRQLLQNQITTL